MTATFTDRVIRFWVLWFRPRWVKFLWGFMGDWPKLEVPRETFPDIAGFLKDCSWRPDPWWQLFDAIDPPALFRRTREGDCDEFAFYALTSLCTVDEKYMLTVIVRPLKRAHAVCVFRLGAEWWHIGNWNGCERDGPYGSVSEIITEITGSGRLVCATLRDEALEEILVMEG